MIFIGWEVMGLCSYLLIGFWYARTYPDPNKITPREAGVKAFMTTRVADVFMLLGHRFLVQPDWFRCRSMKFFSAEKTHGTGASVVPRHSGRASDLLPVVHRHGRQERAFPLHTWLPDAMEGPTPVSAMIHAAAMVSAGVYWLSAYPAAGRHGASRPHA